jgi:polyhydroxyalkanoate synthase subunit PhaC
MLCAGADRPSDFAPSPDHGKSTATLEEKAMATLATPAPELAQRATEVLAGPNAFVGLNLADLAATAGKIASMAVRSPLSVIEHEAALVSELARVLAGRSSVAPAASDKRFTDPVWLSNPAYRRYLQAYLACSQGVGSMVDGLGLKGLDAQRGRFLTTLVADALAPSNTFAGNPAAVRKAFETGGASLAAGLRNLVGDLLHNGAMPSQVDKTAFKVGGNLANTPGAVVFRNEVLELIQYRPATAKVHARPALLVPPQINRAYVYDMAPGKSLVKYLVDSGFQVFLVSWRNPTAEHSHWGMAEYVAALLEAIDAIKTICASRDVTVHAACSGAMTVAALLGHLAALKDRSVHCTTQMVAVMDQAEDSQIGLLASPRAIARAKAASARKGVLEGGAMGRVFAWLRPNDLVWNYWVNNYLLGNAPPAFDILYWNSDTTRLPAKFHAELLDVFGARLLATPGALQILGTPIDLSALRCDRYVMAGLTDHITPWRSCYRTARMMGGKMTMVVSASGHIQSLINPPGNAKAKYYLNADLPDHPDQWLAGATQHNDSWWPHWRDWLAARSGRLKAAPAALGHASYPMLADAPGTYMLA